MTDARERLVEAGVAILERDGVAGLSARNVAAAAGTSTMAVYTHFDGMTGVIGAIADDAFARFATALTDVPQTADPIADFMSMGLAYHRFALAHPQRYQLMFGTSAPETLLSRRSDLTVTGSASAHAGWGLSFEALLRAVRRMIAAGIIRDDGEAVMAGRFWSINHGAVMLELAGFFGHEGHGVLEILGPLTVDVFVGMGADRDATLRSLAAVVATLD
jgi:AcrR family transcriptional regulator